MDPFLILLLCAVAGYVLWRLPSRVQMAKDDTEIAKLKAEAAVAEQKARLAAKDAPIEVSAQIALMQAEAEIKLWAEKGNAEKVLEFTRKKHELEKELGRI